MTRLPRICGDAADPAPATMRLFIADVEFMRYCGIWTEHRLPIDDPRMAPYKRLIPSNRLGTPLEIGAAVAFLASDDAELITGQTIICDGGGYLH